MGESIGERILRLRNSKAWSRPELGRQMAKAIGREDPFTGEAVRRWEEGIDQPGREPRAALAKVFGRSESYIEFGDQPQEHRLRETAVEYNAPSQDAMEIARAFDQLDDGGRKYIRDHLALFKRWRAVISRQGKHDAVISEGEQTHHRRAKNKKAG